MSDLAVTVPLDMRYERTPDGQLWTASPLTYSFWTRYLDVFTEVRVVARVTECREPVPGSHRADGPGVVPAPVPDFRGMGDYARRHLDVQRAVRRAVRDAADGALILRIPLVMGTSAPDPFLVGRPFGVEVVGDASDAFARGAHPHPLRAAFRWWFTRAQRRYCARACAAAYVTERALQARFPASGSGALGPAFSTHYSSIDLEPDQFRPPSPPRPGGTVRLVTVGSLENDFKGTDVLIEAVARCRRQGQDVELTVVGDGVRRPALEDLATALGIAPQVTFTGRLVAGEAVRGVLDESDLFVLPSRHEGLPRAMIEAMARGLPCVGTRIAGIPELLPDSALCPPNDPAELASVVARLVSSPDDARNLAGACHAKAAEFRRDVLQLRRREFYQRVHDETLVWLGRSRA